MKGGGGLPCSVEFHILQIDFLEKWWAKVFGLKEDQKKQLGGSLDIVVVL